MREDQQRALRLFGEALDLSPESRAQFLARVCEGNPELKANLEALLADDDRLGASLVTHTVEGHQLLVPHTQAPHPSALPANLRLGRYVVLDQLGSGGMGVVYRGRDEVLDRDVAIKILSVGAFNSEEASRRFKREALALAKLNHARIASVHDLGQQDGTSYIVMEYIVGESLAQRLARGPVPLSQAATLLLQIAEALESAHERGVVHRDLKPANIMLTKKGEVKVLDFGIAKLLEAPGDDVTLTAAQTRGLLGTPFAMSPEQINGVQVDARTDLWSLGIVFYELLTGRPPFQAESQILLLRAILEEPVPPVHRLRPEAPASAVRIVSRALQKDPATRYQTASEVVRDAAQLVGELQATTADGGTRKGPSTLQLIIALVLTFAVMTGAGYLLYRRNAHQQWAREEAPGQIADLFASNRAIPGFLLLQTAQSYLPSDGHLKKLAEDNTLSSTITSSPAGAKVRIQDYATPNGPWLSLGTTPLKNARIPQGYFRWQVTQPGAGALVTAPESSEDIAFPLDASFRAPPGMVFEPGGVWGDYVGFIGWLGPLTLPPAYIDRTEVTNREFQQFVDSGGYRTAGYWQAALAGNTGPRSSWAELVSHFTDTTDRPGPSTWVGGHYPEGKADEPVSGVSWFEASAYAAFAGKQLPTVAQWYKAAPPELASSIVPASNIAGKALAPVAAYQGLGPLGTLDMAGNVREWAANPVEGDLRYILGGSWRSPSYMYFTPEAASPFDRSALNGFRCVRNLGPLPPAAQALIKPIQRNFARYKPASDTVFKAYELLYAYPNAPLNARSEGIVAETVDWREEKVTFDAGYGGERMAAYLFLPKKVRPPYQTVLFFPSARVEFLRDNDNGRKLGDVNFFDYIVQSGRAVMYPVYQNTYERRVKFFLPSASQSIELTTEWYKDAARSLDYLATRPEFDSNRLAYLGVSMGSACGVINTALLQNRLQTAIFLDGGYFLDVPPPGGDQADFAPRIKKPVLMVNGRYDYTFSVENAQNPLFAMLGTPPKDKEHVLLDTPHDVTQQRPELIRVVLSWLDRYLGPTHD